MKDIIIEIKNPIDYEFIRNSLIEIKKGNDILKEFRLVNEIDYFLLAIKKNGKYEISPYGEIILKYIENEDDWKLLKANVSKEELPYILPLELIKHSPKYESEHIPTLPQWLRDIK
ncbi:hypothetical protein NMU81_00885 [Pasteurella multocida]|nr:hypothetical protein [Pasteurella multocida]